MCQSHSLVNYKKTVKKKNMPISIVVIITIIAGQILTASKVPVQLVILSYLLNDKQTCSPVVLINLVIK